MVPKTLTQCLKLITMRHNLILLIPLVETPVINNARNYSLANNEWVCPILDKAIGIIAKVD